MHDKYDDAPIEYSGHHNDLARIDMRHKVSNLRPSPTEVCILLMILLNFIMVSNLCICESFTVKENGKVGIVIILEFLQSGTSIEKAAFYKIGHLAEPHKFLFSIY